MSVLTFLTDYYPILERCKSLLTTDLTATTWVRNTAYSTNALVKATSGLITSYFRCVTAGTSGNAEPTWNTGFLGATADGTVSWRQEDPIFILDNEPVDFSYPCIIARDIRVMSEVQIASGNQPQSLLRVDLSVISYQGAPASKTWVQTRAQAYDVLKQTKNVIRKYTNLNSYTGVLSTTAGVDTLPDYQAPVFYQVNLLWIIKMLSKVSSS